MRKLVSQSSSPTKVFAALSLLLRIKKLLHDQLHALIHFLVVMVLQYLQLFSSLQGDELGFVGIVGQVIVFLHISAIQEDGFQQAQYFQHDLAVAAGGHVGDNNLKDFLFDQEPALVLAADVEVGDQGVQTSDRQGRGVELEELQNLENDLLADRFPLGVEQLQDILGAVLVVDKETLHAPDGAFVDLLALDEEELLDVSDVLLEHVVGIDLSGIDKEIENICEVAVDLGVEHFRVREENAEVLDDNHGVYFTLQLVIALPLERLDHFVQRLVQLSEQVLVTVIDFVVAVLLKNHVAEVG